MCVWSLLLSTHICQKEEELLIIRQQEEAERGWFTSRLVFLCHLAIYFTWHRDNIVLLPQLIIFHYVKKLSCAVWGEQNSIIPVIYKFFSKWRQSLHILLPTYFNFFWILSLHHLSHFVLKGVASRSWGPVGENWLDCRSKHDIKGMNEQWKQIVSHHVPISVVHYSYLIDILTRYGQCTPSLKLVPCTSQSLTKFIIFFIDSSLKFVRNIEKEVLHWRVTLVVNHPK